MPAMISRSSVALDPRGCSTLGALAFRRLLLLLPNWVRNTIRHEHHGGRQQPDDYAKLPIRRSHGEPDCPSDPDRRRCLDPTHIEAALEDDGAAEKAEAG